jgi:hypothetical protein
MEALMKSDAFVPPTTMSRGVVGFLAVLTLMGIVGFLVTMVLGFEEPHGPMLLVAGAMTLAAPITVLVHLRVTHGLTREEKRIWLKEFRSAEVWSALSEYLSSANLSDGAKRRGQAALARHESK